jgi:iron complex transport system ATP-binding protein
MLELRSVGFAYGIDDVSFAVERPQLVALVGQNGSGKSTLLKIVARVIAPLRGSVLVDGRPLAEWPAKEYARTTGFLPQEPDATFSMSAIDVVVSGRAPFLTRFAWEGESDYRAAEEALALCDATHLAGRYLDEMSGGERKRVFLARVLAGKPRLVLLDEPFAALDVAHVQQFSRLLRDIADRTGATILFASHDLNWAAAYSDRVLVLRAGRLALDATPAEVMTPETMRALFDFDAAAVEAGGRRWIVPRV